MKKSAAAMAMSNLRAGNLAVGRSGGMGLTHHLNLKPQVPASQTQVQTRLSVKQFFTGDLAKHFFRLPPSAVVSRDMKKSAAIMAMSNPRTRKLAIGRNGGMGLTHHLDV